MTFKNSTKPNGVAYVTFQQPEDCKVALEYLQQPAKDDKIDVKKEGEEEMKDSDKKEEKDDEEAVKEKKKDGDKNDENN